MQSPVVIVNDLLLALFAQPDDLRQVLFRLPEARPILVELPGPNVPMAQFVFAASEQLEHHGLLRADSLYRLLLAQRPLQSERILAARATILGPDAPPIDVSVIADEARRWPRRSLGLALLVAAALAAGTFVVWQVRLAEERAQDVRDRMILGADHLEHDECADAAAQFRQVLALEPQHPDAQRGLSEAESCSSPP